MPTSDGDVRIPIYYVPRPYQHAAWGRRLSGDVNYYFKIWARQLGKDTDDIQFSLFNAYQHPGTQSAYVGLDNKWIRRNIWDKYIDGRKHWASYPAELIDVAETHQKVSLLNNPEDQAPALIQFIGFKESESLIGSSYEFFYISELSLYRRGAFNFIQPIWDNKEAEGGTFSVNFNFTPRGMSNIAADMLAAYTGEADPAAWPGKHGNVYVDYLPADKAVRSDGTRIFSDEQLENIRQRYVRSMGNDLLFRQEYLCEFLAVNAGLVFPGIEKVREEKRYVPYNIDTAKPVYMAWDISSKDKQTDWTSCIVFQYYNGRMFIYDWFEDNRLSVVECVANMAERPYFHLIRAACLPWDSDRSGSSSSPLEECRRMFPNIQWLKLDRKYVSDSINDARRQLGNAIINADKCDWLMECFESWEYRELSGVDDWAATPKHDRFSHLMDAYRYACDLIKQYPYVMENDGRPRPMPSSYEQWDLEDVDETTWDDMPPGMRPSKFSPLRKKKPSDIYDLGGFDYDDFIAEKERLQGPPADSPLHLL